jgi:hypothetical protein
MTSIFRLVTFSSIALLVFGCGSRSAKFDPVMRDIQAGTLVIPASGIVQLPRRFAGLTPRSEVFAAKKADGRLFILFPTWYGRGNDLEGYLYCSGVLQPSDYYTTDWGAGGKHRHLKIAGRDMLTIRDYKPHWYSVTRRLD